MADELWKWKRIMEIKRKENEELEKKVKLAEEKKCLICGAKRKDCVC